MTESIPNTGNHLEMAERLNEIMKFAYKCKVRVPLSRIAVNSHCVK